MSGAIPVGGRWIVPGNRWDLLPGAPDPPEVTAVVVHYRDPARLALVLEGLAGQTHPATRLQVVVADDGSPQRPEVPEHVTVVGQADRGFRAAAARNLGAAAADGEIVCFLDGDTVPEPGYVAAATALPAVDPDVVVVGRRRHADLSGWRPGDVAGWFRGERPPPTELTEPAWLTSAYRDSDDLLRVDERSYRFVISAVLTCHREMLDATGGFDETMTGYGGEDWEFAHRAFTAGAVLAHRRDAVAWHDGPEWGEREGETAEGRAGKNRETLALAARIPDRAARGPGHWASAPGLLAEITGGSLTARAASVRSLLDARPDAVVVVDHDTAVACDHPQVSAEPPDRRTMQRIPLRLHAIVPVRFDAVDALASVVWSADAGELRTTDGTVTLTAARAAHRSQRHGIPLERLFPVLTAAPLPRIADGAPLESELNRG